jgi:hypothetical protein
MNPVLRTTLWIGLLATLLVAVLLSLFGAWLYSEGLPPGTVVTIDGDRFVVPELTHASHWLAAAAVVLLASLAIVLVAPVVIVFGVGVPLAAGALSIAIALLMFALLLLPFVWLARWLWKDWRKGRTIDA